jgi:bacterial/archaeal transporter family protein
VKPQLLALLTALAWGVGGHFEKRGLHLGQLSPQMGITIRTAVALIILGILSYSRWKTLPQAGPRAVVYLVIGGGVVAGAVGMLCFYAALKSAPLSRVMPIAFTSPCFWRLDGDYFRRGSTFCKDSGGDTSYGRWNHPSDGGVDKKSSWSES